MALFLSRCLILICVIGKTHTEAIDNNVTSQNLTQYEENTKYFDCTTNLCVSKCCPENNFVNLNPLTFSDFPCLPFENTTEKNLELQLQLPNGTVSFGSYNHKLAYLVHLKLCKLYEITQVILLPNASLLLPSTNEILWQADYCIDYFKIDNTFSKSASVCSLTFNVPPEEAIRHFLHPLGFFTSCVFLAVTFICHIIIPKLRDMQGLCFMNYVAALFFAFMFLSANRLIPDRFSEKGCVALAVLSYFALLSSFFWLNVMSFDIWRVIRGSVHAIRMQQMRDQGKILFVIYSVYGWGVPLIMALTTLIIHVLHFANKLPDHFIKPSFRSQKCWFPNNLTVLFVYYYGVIAVLFFINIVFYIHICVMLYRVGAAFKCCSKDMSHRGELRMSSKSNLSTFWHRFCLFLLMGLNWTTEVLSLIPPPSMWLITDLINTFQGLFIFLIFIRSTKKRTLIADAWKKAIQATHNKKISVGQVKFVKSNGHVGIGNRLELTNEIFLSHSKSKSPISHTHLIRKSL